MPELNDRDLIGYGQCPPVPNWPDKARVAVSFVINYEEGGEYSFPEGDGVSESYLAEFKMDAFPSGHRTLAVESIYDFGSRAGIWRLLTAFGDRAIPGTIYAVGRAVQLNPEPVQGFHEKGWEIASHHYRWINYHDMSESEERDHLNRAIDCIQGAVGERPVGIYGGRTSLNTRKLVAEDGGFIWESDAYDDELPYWRTVENKPYLIIPYQLDCNDFRYAVTPGWTSGDDFFTYVKNTFDLLYAEGARQPKMMSIGLHARISGRPGRTAALLRFLDYLQTKNNVWITTRREIAEHWYKQHPYSPA